ncbi:MAG: replication-associated recombination protein A, partial [Clostridia bacterium]|nr:replication-associated recombination protein A [Clostridia bacterium]
MSAPLADRLRPKTIEDMVGQEHLIGKDKMLYNIIKSGKIPNMIFYGPSGVGKTTLASIIASGANMTFHKLNGTNCSTADIKQIVEETKTFSGIDGILLYLDEIQYLNKKQQQSLLQYIENGSITLIASTTENPYFYVYSAILSRSTVFEFKAVEAEDTIPVIKRAFTKMRDEIGEIEADDEVIRTISARCGGDVRKAINAVELCTLSAKDDGGKRVITKDLAEDLTQQSGMRYDRDGDEHYDIISAYQKSMRGSDPNAALHYLARLLQVGDLPSACRRLMVCACEDVGLANPQIISIVKSAVDTAQALGLPEARIPLADAVVLVSISPKSNSAYNGINSAMQDISMGNAGPIPRQLQNKHFDSAEVENKGQFYKYP